MDEEYLRYIASDLLNLESLQIDKVNIIDKYNHVKDQKWVEVGVELAKNEPLEKLKKCNETVSAIILDRAYKYRAKINKWVVVYSYDDDELVSFSVRSGIDIFTDKIVHNIRSEIMKLEIFPIEKVGWQVDKFLTPYFFLMIDLSEDADIDTANKLHDTVDDIVYKYSDKDDYDDNSWHAAYYFKGRFVECHLQRGRRRT